MDKKTKSRILKISIIVFIFLTCFWLLCGDRTDTYYDNESNCSNAIYSNNLIDIKMEYCYYSFKYGVTDSLSEEDGKYSSNIAFENKTSNTDILLKSFDVRYLSNDKIIPNNKYYNYSSSKYKPIKYNNYDSIDYKYKIIPGTVSSKYWKSGDKTFSNYRIYYFIFDKDMRQFDNITIEINIKLDINKKEEVIHKSIPIKLSRGYTLNFED